MRHFLLALLASLGSMFLSCGDGDAVNAPQSPVLVHWSGDWGNAGWDHHRNLEWEGKEYRYFELRFGDVVVSERMAFRNGTVEALDLDADGAPTGSRVVFDFREIDGDWNLPGNGFGGVLATGELYYFWQDFAEDLEPSRIGVWALRPEDDFMYGFAEVGFECGAPFWKSKTPEEPFPVEVLQGLPSSPIASARDSSERFLAQLDRRAWTLRISNDADGGSARKDAVVDMHAFEHPPAPDEPVCLSAVEDSFVVYLREKRYAFSMDLESREVDYYLSEKGLWVEGLQVLANSSRGGFFKALAPLADPERTYGSLRRQLLAEMDRAGNDLDRAVLVFYALDALEDLPHYPVFQTQFCVFDAQSGLPIALESIVRESPRWVAGRLRDPYGKGDPFLDGYPGRNSGGALAREENQSAAMGFWRLLDADYDSRGQLERLRVYAAGRLRLNAKEMFALRPLRSLEIVGPGPDSGDPILEALPPELNWLENLESLALEHASLPPLGVLELYDKGNFPSGSKTGPGMPHPGYVTMENIKTLVLVDCGLEGEDLSFLSKLTQLEMLVLEGNALPPESGELLRMNLPYAHVIL